MAPTLGSPSAFSAYTPSPRTSRVWVFSPRSADEANALPVMLCLLTVGEGKWGAAEVSNIRAAGRDVDHRKRCMWQGAGCHREGGWFSLAGGQAGRRRGTRR